MLHRNPSPRLEVPYSTLMASSSVEHVSSDTDFIEWSSSDDTASDRPGAGRNLGNFYRFCGKHVERAINTIAVRSGHKPKAAAIWSSNASLVMTHPKAQYIFPANIQAMEVESSNDTASDLSGAGRNLGKLYRASGRYVGQAVNEFAERRGHGPQAVAVRILRRYKCRTGRCNHFGKCEKIQRKDCNKLIQYTK